MNDSSLAKIESLISDLLVDIGEDPSREGLEKTPNRVASSWLTFAQGYNQTPEDVVGDAVFTEKCDEIVAAGYEGFKFG